MNVHSLACQAVVNGRSADVIITRYVNHINDFSVSYLDFDVSYNLYPSRV